MRRLFESIHVLAKAGMNKSAIARTLGVHRHTVQKYSALEAAPEREPRVHKVSALAPYEGYILSNASSTMGAATQPRSTRRSSSRATPALTRTSCASPSTSEKVRA